MASGLSWLLLLLLEHLGAGEEFLEEAQGGGLVGGMGLQPHLQPGGGGVELGEHVVETE